MIRLGVQARALGLSTRILCCTSICTVRSAGTTIDAEYVVSKLKGLDAQSQAEHILSLHATGRVSIHRRATGKVPSEQWVSLYETTMDKGDIEKAFTCAQGSSLAARPPKTPTPTGLVQLMDFTSSDEMQRVKERIKTMFPRLRLVQEHSSGKDVQGRRTHTISVRLKESVIGADLSPEEQIAVSSFRGESVGSSYASTFRRATAQALRCVGLDYPSMEDSDSAGVSPLSLYLDVLHASCSSLVVSILSSTSSVTIKITDGETTLCVLTGQQKYALSLLVSAMESAAIKTSPAQADAVKQRLVQSPLVLVLPDTNIRVKHILRRLLAYHYGISASDVQFHITSVISGVYQCEVKASVPHPTEDDGRLECTLSTASDTSKRSAAQLASTMAIKTHFPRIYEEQLSFHPEFEQLLTDAEAAMETVSPPHISQGLRAQLEWALLGSGLKVRIDTQRLLPNSIHQELRACVSQLTWVSAVHFVGAETADECVARAFDAKKSRSEQKAVAAAIARKFPVKCGAAVAKAQSEGLLTGADPTECGAVKLVTEEPVPEVEDRLLAAIQGTPRQVLACSWDPVDNALSYLRGLGNRYAASPHGGAGVGDFNESTVMETESGKHVTTLSLIPPVQAGGGPDSRKVCASASSTLKIVSIIRAYTKLFEVVFSAHPVDHSGMHSFYASLGPEQKPPIATLVDLLPSQFPSSTPLESIVKSLTVLYGLQIELCTRTERGGYAVELWGRIPGESSNGEDSMFFLGVGYGRTVQQAAIRCSQYCYQSHVRPHLNIFDGRTVLSGTFDVLFSNSSTLGELISAVTTEISTMQSPTQCRGTIKIKFCIESDSSYECILYGVAEKSSVQLEKASGRTLPAAIKSLSQYISREMDLIFALPPRAEAVPALEALKGVWASTFGITVSVDTVLVKSLWHCRLSLELDPTRYYCLSTGTAARKNEAVESAALTALDELYGEDTSPRGEDPGCCACHSIFTLL